MIWILGLSLCWAEDSKQWLKLQQARLMMMDSEQIKGSVDLLNTIIAQSEPDDFIVSEAEYWKGRALYEMGFVDHAVERMTVASNDYEIRGDALYFLQQSKAWELRVQQLPYSGTPWVNLDGRYSRQSSLLWVCAIDASAGRFSNIALTIESAEFPLYLTVELVDWRNERWVWRDVVPDSSQPVSIRLEQFRSPRDEDRYWYRNILVTAESEDGRRVPITLMETELR